VISEVSDLSLYPVLGSSECGKRSSSIWAYREVKTRSSISRQMSLPLTSAREIVSASAIKAMSSSVGAISTGEAARLRECAQAYMRSTATDTSNPNRP
jgi:hypothetical protein